MIWPWSEIAKWKRSAEHHERIAQVRLNMYDALLIEYQNLSLAMRGAHKGIWRLKQKLKRQDGRSCTMYHPHEEMGEGCQLRTEIARLKNEMGHWTWVRFKQIEDENNRLREALQLLHSVQNGCPLPSYEKDWNRAMELTEQILKEQS